MANGGGIEGRSNQRKRSKSEMVAEIKAAVGGGEDERGLDWGREAWQQGKE